MLARQTLDRSRLVRGVMVDVHIGVLTPACHHVCDEPFKSLLLCPQVERPKRFVPRFRPLVILKRQYASEVLKPMFEYEAVSFEIKEDISRGRGGKCGEASVRLSCLQQFVNEMPLFSSFDLETRLLVDSKKGGVPDPVYLGSGGQI